MTKQKVEPVPIQPKEIIPQKKPFPWLLFAGIFTLAFFISTTAYYLWHIYTAPISTKSSITPQKIIASATQKPEKNIPTKEKEIVGFLPSWIVAKKSKVYPERLTQLVYFGLGVNETGDLIKYKEDGRAVAEWAQFNSSYFQDIQKEASKSATKVLITIKNFDNKKIDNLISNKLSTDRLIKQTLELLDKYNIDGVNIDFEYVTKTQFPTAKFFNRFLESFVKAIKEKDSNLLVSVDINATAVLQDPAYDMVKIGELADQVILMGYDFTRAGSTKAGPVAPLYEDDNKGSVNKSLKSLNGRVPLDKLILAIPFYGYEWQTYNQNYKSPTVPNSGAIATYRRVYDLINERDDIQISWEKKPKSAWLVYRQSGAIKQIYYESPKSIEAKINFIQEKSLAGVAIWALGYEGNYQEPWEVIKKHLQQ